MNRFARIMQMLGWLGVALLGAVWIQGFFVHDIAPRLARHSTIALAAAGFCLLPRFWTISYLLLAARGRAVASRVQRGAAGQGVAEATARVRRRALVASGAALVALSGSFALAGAIVLRRASPAAHAAAGFVAIALQIVALLLERRALLADAREMADLAPPASAVEASRDPARGTA